MDLGRPIFDSSPSHADHMLFQGARSFVVFEDGANKRRPFFTTAEELMEEEYHDEQVPEKKRRLTAEQVLLLEKSFEADNKLEPERKIELAKKLGLQPRQVAVWFQNRRARWKTKQLESDFDRLKSSYDAVVAHRDSLLKDNCRLQSQVESLTEKLREKEIALAGLPLSDQRDEKEINHLPPPPSPAPVLSPRREEDRLSTGSRGSAIIDGEAATLIVDGSRDYCFQAGGLGSEEDGSVSVDGFSYLAVGTFAEAAHEDNWWVWN